MTSDVHSKAGVPEPVISFLRQAGVPDITSFIGRCEMFRARLVEENRKFNLTRITSDEEFWVKHVADSISIAMFFDELRSGTPRLADIGCGAGIPSVILACAFEGLEVCAVESIGKKADFTDRISKELGLGKLTVMNRRAREMAVSGRWPGYFNLITARAVKSETVYGETRRMLHADGKMVFYKTPSSMETDICGLRQSSAKDAFKWECTPVFPLPLGHGMRMFIYGSKVTQEPGMRV